jgi:hypothetical protein
MPIVDGEYKFIYVDVGQQGRTSDGGAFFFFLQGHSSTGNYYEWPSNLQIPNETALLGTEIRTPYMIVGDDAFCWSENLIKPYPGIQSKGSPQ